jgi:hypothetical protein
MKRYIFMVVLVIPLIIFSECKKTDEGEALAEQEFLPEIEVDQEQITGGLGLNFRILKTGAVGSSLVHKFFWVVLPDMPSQEDLRSLSDAIIKSVIAKKPRVYHSFTIHFFLEKDIQDGNLEGKRFAYANFLPEGSWLKVGRVPVDDYKDYRLLVTMIERYKH